MSDITNQLPGVVDVKAIRDAGKGKGVELFGIRLRSTGFTWSIGPNKIDDIIHNAKVAADMVKVFDGKLKKLQELGKVAEERQSAAVKEFNETADKIQFHANRFEALDKNKNDAEAKLGAARSDLDNTDPEDPNAVAAARARLGQAQREFDAIKRDWDDSKYWVDNGERIIGELKAKIDATRADVEAVNKAAEEFQKVIPGVLAEIGKEMGLENVFIHENKRDGNGKFTNDAMSFTEQASTLLQVWGSTMIDGVELELRDKDGKQIAPEDDPRLINPLKRERFSTLEVVGDKAKIKREEAMIVRHMGALQIYRKMFQQMFEELTAIATRRRS
ncbi:MAG: hypothetical protein FJZ01_05615 [Candidatus Sericytochromatia bacterium]|nr:hypothetical protein [Candidatus Tanganyikabacteria bacterium]